VEKEGQRRLTDLPGEGEATERMKKVDVSKGLRFERKGKRKIKTFDSSGANSFDQEWVEVQ